MGHASVVPGGLMTHEGTIAFEDLKRRPPS